MKQLLQNINKVEYIEPRYLLNVQLVKNDKVVLRYWRNFVEQPIDGLAQCEVTEAVEDGTRLRTVKLTFPTACPIVADDLRLAWRITTVTGEQYIIGTTETPYPVALVQNSFPDEATDRSGYQVTVTWKTPLSLLRIID